MPSNSMVNTAPFKRRKIVAHSFNCCAPLALERAMPFSANTPANRPAKASPSSSVSTSRSLRGTISIAQQQGLLSGKRTTMIRARMPDELIAAAKRKTGITSDSKLLEAALANIVVADDYAEWLFSQRGTISADLDLEF